MICRRCGGSIGEGSDNCPLCGISQHTYITPRNLHGLKTAEPKKKLTKNRVMPIVAVVVSVVAVAAMLYFSGKENEKNDFQQVLDAFEEKDETKMYLAVGQFKKNNPNSNLVVDVERYYWALMTGKAPEDFEEDYLNAEPLTEAEAQVKREQENTERLIAEAKDSILTIEKIVLSEPNPEGGISVSVNWRNMSEKRIKEIRFVFEAFDADGKPAYCEVRDTNKATLQETKYVRPNKAGNAYYSIWVNTWFNTDIDHADLLRVRIFYEDDTSEYLPQDICKLIMA